MLVEKAKLDAIEKKITLPTELVAPIKKGQKLGEIEFFVGKEKVGATDIIAAESIKKASPFTIFLRLAENLLYG